MELNGWDLAALGVKALLYAATLCAAGGMFFLLYSAPLIFPEQQRRIRQWVGLCVGVAIVTSGLRITLLAASMGDGSAAGVLDGGMLRMVLQAGEARATGIRIAGLLLTAAVLIVARRHVILALLGALMAASSFAWIGHAWAAGRWSVAVLSLHLIGLAFWLGALVPLLLVGRKGGLTTLARAAKRFGELAVIGVGMLLLAGTLLLTIFLRHFSDLWNTNYGRLVSVKLAAVSMLLGAAAVNKLRFTPRLQAQDSAAARGLLRSIRAELLLGGLILVITAALTSLVGPSGLD